MIFGSTPRRHSRCLLSAGIRSGLLALFGLLILAQPAWAYLDPGTGSYLLQMFVAVLLGAGVAVKVYWRKITAFLSSRRAGQPGKTHDDV